MELELLPRTHADVSSPWCTDFEPMASIELFVGVAVSDLNLNFAFTDPDCYWLAGSPA